MAKTILVHAGRRLALATAVLATALGLAAVRWFDPEPAVYAAIVDRAHATFDYAVASVPTDCRLGQDPLPELPPALVAAYRAANAPGAGPGDLSRLRDRAAIVDSAQLARFTGVRAVYEAGRERLPILRLSRVGFSADRSDALLCVSGAYGGRLVHLHYSDGAWHVVASDAVWIASSGSPTQLTAAG